MSISSRITEMEQHIGNAYDKIEDLGVDLTNVDKNINNISSMLEEVWNEYPKVTATDVEEATLNETKKGRMEIDLRGQTEQEQLSGKNLFVVADRTNTNANVRCVLNNNKITLNGTADRVSLQQTYFNINGTQNKNANYWNYDTTTSGFTLPAGTYTIALHNIAGSFTTPSTLYLRVTKIQSSTPRPALATIDLTSTTKTATFTIAEETSVKIQIQISISPDTEVAVPVFNNYSFNLQLEQGSTPTSYEPYCGGIPSPNPDFPQPIKNVTGSANVKIQNKNLIASSYIINGSFGIGNAGKQIIINNTGYADLNTNIYRTIRIPFLKAGTYTISINWNRTARIIRQFNSNNVVEGPTTGNTRTITTTEDGIYAFVFRDETSNAFTDNDYTIQLELGSTATSYVPHQEQNLPLTLGDIELNKIDTAQDYFYKENGKWYKHQEIGKVIYDGSADENWVIDNVNVGQFSIWQSGSTNKPIYSNYFGYKLTYSSTGKPYIRPATNKFYFEIGTEMLPEVSVSALKTWLSTHNTEIYYQLSTPTNTEITDTTLISQLEAIKNARSYDDITYITSTSDELAFIMDVEILSNGVSSSNTRTLALGSLNKGSVNNINEVDTEDTEVAQDAEDETSVESEE